MRGRTKPYDIQRVPKYPDALQIYRIPASRFWQARLFVERKYIRKSTKTESHSEAIEFAKRLYDDILVAQRMDFEVHTDTFAACANRLLERQEALVNRSERDARINVEDRKKLNKDILPLFGMMGVAEITTDKIEDYLNQLSAERKLAPSTLQKHLVVIRKVLSEAKRKDFIKSLPIFPTIRRRDNPRPCFNDHEYHLLRRTAPRLAKKGIKVRYVPLTEEIGDFIVFHVNVFVRLSDLKLVKHRHIRVVRDQNTKYVLITPPNSKTVTRESASMPTAVDVYERLKKRHEAVGRAGEDDYVFFPEYRNRQYALQTLRRQFEFILEEAGLKYDASDKPRTLYSLRHTALMFRLLKGQNVDIFMLARNALTSVDQLERFYLSHAESRMKIENLQSMARNT
jgi:hypothetical protein